MPHFRLIVLGVLAISCAPVTNDTGTAGDTDSDTDTDTELPCLTIGALSGQVVSLTGDPPASRLFSVCGSSCENFPGAIDETGAFAVQPTDCWYPIEPWPRPFFWLHGLDTSASLFYDFVPEYVPEGTWHVESIDLTTPLVAPSLDDMTLADASAETLTAGGVSLTWSAEGVDFPLGHDDTRIGIVDLAPASWPPIAGVETLSVLVAVYPDDTEFDPPADLTLPNVGLDPGTEVEIVVIGDLTDPLAVPTGTAVVVGTGEVTGDGSSVVADGGLEVLRWVGYRPAAR